METVYFSNKADEQSQPLSKEGAESQNSCGSGLTASN